MNASPATPAAGTTRRSFAHSSRSAAAATMRRDMKKPDDPRETYNPLRRAAEWVGGVTGRYGNAMFAVLPSAVVGAVQRMRGDTHVDQATKLLLTTYLVQGTVVGAGTGVVMPHPVVSTTLLGLKGAAISAAQFDMQAQGGGGSAIASAIQTRVNEAIAREPQNVTTIGKIFRGAAVAVPAGCKAALPVGDSMGRGSTAGIIEGIRGMARVWKRAEEPATAPGGEPSAASTSTASPASSGPSASLARRVLKGAVGTVAGVGAGALMAIPGLVQGERAALNLQKDLGPLVRKVFVSEIAVAGAVAGSVITGGLVPVAIGGGAALAAGLVASKALKDTKTDARIARDVCEEVERQVKSARSTGDAQYDSARDTVVGSLVGAASAIKSAYSRAYNRASRMI